MTSTIHAYYIIGIVMEYVRKNSLYNKRNFEFNDL